MEQRQGVSPTSVVRSRWNAGAKIDQKMPRTAPYRMYRMYRMCRMCRVRRMAATGRLRRTASAQHP